MTRSLPTTLLLAATLLLSACAGQMAASDTHDARQSLDWVGTYRGTLPCADCEGIETTLSLQSDLGYTLRRNYLHRAAAEFQTHGRFTWESDGNTIRLQGKDGGRYRVAENRLLQLDGDGRIITGALAEHYVLTKSGNSDITERYWKLVELMGKPVGATAREPHLILKDVDGRIAGSGGCNALMGHYELRPGQRIQFSQMGATMMACAEGMDVEQQFFKMLEQVDNYSVNGNRLTLQRARMAPFARFEAVYLQ